MTYKQKPDPGPSPKLDAPNIQGNFLDFSTTFAANHTPLNDINQGDHETIIFQRQSSDPVDNIVFNSAILFCKNATSRSGTQPQLFVRVPKFLPNKLNPAKPGNPSVQLTYNTVNLVGPQYQSFLPGGNILYFGSVSGNSATAIDVTVNLTPAPTKILSVIAVPYSKTIQGGGQNSRSYSVKVIVDNVTNSSFRITSTGNEFEGSNQPYKFGYLVIGKA